MSRRRYPHRDVTCVYDDAGNVIETHEHAANHASFALHTATIFSRRLAVSGLR